MPFYRERSTRTTMGSLLVVLLLRCAWLVDWLLGVGWAQGGGRGVLGGIDPDRQNVHVTGRTLALPRGRPAGVLTDSLTVNPLDLNPFLTGRPTTTWPS